MDYKYKYNKYKLKYINLKKNQHNDQTGGVRVECPENKKMCEPPTQYMGLCINNEDNCDAEYDEQKLGMSIPTISWDNPETDKDDITKYELGLKKGYIENNLNKNCGISIILNKYVNTDDNCSVPDRFSIFTLNIMGIIRNNEDKLKLMEHRVNILINEINEKNPDVMCFQEMSAEVLNKLYPIIREKYPYCYEDDLSEILKQRNKDIEVCIISKYQPRKVTVMNLGGNLGYFNSLAMIEYDNINIFNCYFQAGSIASPGQRLKWQHYSRCRAQQFKHIKNLILQNIEKPSIVLGDFNCHLDGDIKDWPELKYLQDMQLLDSWKIINPHDLGLTENTDLNHLRFNNKFETKHYRYDAILFIGNIRPLSSIIIGDKSKIIEDDEINRIYEKVILPKDGLQNPNLRIAHKQNDKNYYDLFISDHFGVMSEFKFV